MADTIQPDEPAAQAAATRTAAQAAATRTAAQAAATRTAAQAAATRTAAQAAATRTAAQPAADERAAQDPHVGTGAPKGTDAELHYQRFDVYTRLLHLMVIISFLSLAVTGMTIKFAGVGVFQALSRLMGGYEVTGFIHRVAAFITFLYIVLHVVYLFKKKTKKRRTMKDMFSGERTMWFRKQDIIEFGQTIKWFLGIGPRPDYGRWTYWEKFDYFAVFWGVIVIGFSGMVLWFPEWFTAIGLPGWFINVSTIIHSDEALLATGFIFTVHFFNTHFRPDKFPMDPVIFTGSVSLEELKEDRPRQYRLLVESGRLESRLVPPPNPTFLKWARVFGLTALTTGLLTVIMIIYSMIFLYR